MTAACQICGQLVQGAPALEIGPERDQAEYANLVPGMVQHVGHHHPELLQSAAAVAQMCVALFSGLAFESSASGFCGQIEAARLALIDGIKSAAVVIRRPAVKVMDFSRE